MGAEAPTLTPVSPHYARAACFSEYWTNASHERIGVRSSHLDWLGAMPIAPSGVRFRRLLVENEPPNIAKDYGTEANFFKGRLT